MRAIAYFAALSVAFAAAAPAAAASFLFSTGDPDGRLAALSGPSLTGVETETADDFVLTQSTHLTGGSFTGLIRDPSGHASITSLSVEIYRVFPNDSDVGRTSGPPTFSTPQVPTRVNSPSDVDLTDRPATGGLIFLPTVLNPLFTAANRVEDGINPQPDEFTGGDGGVTGAEEQIQLWFTNPIDLPAGHYFFVPQVTLDNGASFFWLSSPRPIVPPGTPFPPASTDLQAWIRNEHLAPDWLRIGTDITHTGTFNMAFTLSGFVPEPATWTAMLLGFGLAGAAIRRRRARAA